MREKKRGLEGEGGKEDDFARFTDKVEFNEVVHRPPDLTALPRKVAANDAARRVWHRKPHYDNMLCLYFNIAVDS